MRVEVLRKMEVVVVVHKAMELQVGSYILELTILKRKLQRRQ